MGWFKVAGALFGTGQFVPEIFFWGGRSGVGQDRNTFCTCFPGQNSIGQTKRERDRG